VAQQFARAEERINLINSEAEERIRAERDAASQQQQIIQQAADEAHRRIQQLEAQLSAASAITTPPRTTTAPTIEITTETAHRGNRTDLPGTLSQEGVSARKGDFTPVRVVPARAAGQFAIGATAIAEHSRSEPPQHNNLGPNGTDPNLDIEEGDTTISSASPTLLRHTNHFLDPTSLRGALPQGGASVRGLGRVASGRLPRDYEVGSLTGTFQQACDPFIGGVLPITALSPAPSRSSQKSSEIRFPGDPII
jgi:hypothetical protein